MNTLDKITSLEKQVRDLKTIIDKNNINKLVDKVNALEELDVSILEEAFKPIFEDLDDRLTQLENK